MVQVKNIGAVDGQELVQIYNWPTASTKQALLVGFEKKNATAHAEGITTNVLVPKREAAHWVGDKLVLDEGRYAFGLGNGIKERQRQV